MLVRCHATHFQCPCNILSGKGLPVVSVNGAEPNFDPVIKCFWKRCLKRVRRSSTWEPGAQLNTGKTNYSYSTGRYLERHLSMVDCPYVCMVSTIYSCGLALQSISHVNLLRVTARPCKMPRHRKGSITTRWQVHMSLKQYCLPELWPWDLRPRWNMACTNETRQIRTNRTLWTTPSFNATSTPFK